MVSDKDVYLIERATNTAPLVAVEHLNIAIFNNAILKLAADVLQSTP